MKKTSMKTICFAGMAGLFLAACGTTEPDATPTSVQRAAKADYGELTVDSALSCQSLCGLLAIDASAKTYCGCDDECGTYGDCCDSKAATCDAPPPPPSCDYNDPDRNFLGTSDAQCQALRIACPAGEKYFKDDCGCGCEKAPQSSCDYSDPDRNYFSTEGPAGCAAMFISCEDGWQLFADACGCGCEKAPAPTCDYSDPDRSYSSTEGPAGCAAMFINCEDGWQLFADACGCGCEKDPEGGQFCGGIAAIQCPTGQKCQLDGSYPDAGGTCIPE